MKRSRGMTLVELMMVVAIIASLASLAIPNFLDHVRKVRRAEQELVLPTIETAVKLRLGDESLPWGAYNAAWNPATVPNRFDRSVEGWRPYGFDVDGLMRFGYRIDAIAAAQPTFMVTVREQLSDRLVYRTRNWQLCSGWTLLSDVRDGVALSPTLQPCAALESSGSPGGGLITEPFPILSLCSSAPSST